jgi:hypothetical protein
MDICLSAARAAASRRNGAKSRGPKTQEGKERSSQNALKHGFRAQKFVVVGDEKPQEFAVLEAALMEELAPEGALQSMLAGRIARAAWRLERAERIEAGLFEHHLRGERNPGVALIRDGNGPRAFDTLLRYRGATLAELWRALRLFKALQAEQAPREMREMQRAAIEQQPIEPEARRDSEKIIVIPAAEPIAAEEHGDDTGVEPERAPARCPRPDTPGLEPPIKPDTSGKPCLRAAPSDAIASGSMLQPCGPDEDRNLQHQQRRAPSAEPSRMASGGGAGCRLPAGAEDPGRELSAGGAARCRL